MYQDEIYAAAAGLTGYESDTLYDFCLVAETELENRLKTGVTKESCSGVFIQAAAVLAVSYLNVLENGSGDIESYSAGEVSVRRKSTAAAREMYKALREQAETMMAPFLKDDGFFFREVRG